MRGRTSAVRQLSDCQLTAQHVFSPPTYFNPSFILRFYLSFIFYLAFIYCVLLFTNIIYHVMRTYTCNKPHTLRDAVTGRNRNTIVMNSKPHPKFFTYDHVADIQTTQVVFPCLQSLLVAMLLCVWLDTVNAMLHVRRSVQFSF